MDRVKRQKRDKFDIAEATHAPEYANIQRPVSHKTNAPIEPAHKFEISLEADAFSKEK
jgi:arginyl-tRNA---protein transferase